jgi:hypothetical protein
VAFVACRVGGDECRFNYLGGGVVTRSVMYDDDDVVVADDDPPLVGRGQSKPLALVFVAS